MDICENYLICILININESNRKAMNRNWNLKNEGKTIGQKLVPEGEIRTTLSPKEHFLLIPNYFFELT